MLVTQINNSKKEVLLAASSLSYLGRLAELGLLNALERAKSQGTKALVLCPDVEKSRENPDILPDHKLLAEIQRHSSVKDASGQIKGTILVVDGEKVLSLSEEGIDALAIYSTNNSLVNNFASFFEALWVENELLGDLMRSKRELLKSNEELKVHDKLQREFVNIAAHELRTPITPILITLYLAEQTNTIKGETSFVLTREQHEMLIRNAKRLERLAADILEVARIESQTLELRKENVDLNREIADVVSDAKAHIPFDKQIEITFQSSKEPVILKADRSRLYEVVANLLKNAIRFIQDEGKVIVILEKSDNGKSALVKIADNGKGIDPKILPRLFQKFAASSSEGGTGLGLYISKSIVEAHGGKIWADNNEDNRDGKKGATFTFELPI